MYNLCRAHNQYAVALDSEAYVITSGKAGRASAHVRQHGGSYYCHGDRVQHICADQSRDFEAKPSTANGKYSDAKCCMCKHVYIKATHSQIYNYFVVQIEVSCIKRF